GQFFSRQYGLNGEMIYARAEAGDAAAIQAYEEFGSELAHAMMIALYAFDPELIILGGSVSKAFRYFRKTMMEKLEKNFAYQHALKRLVIETSQLSEIALFGAAALYLDSLEKPKA